MPEFRFQGFGAMVAADFADPVIQAGALAVMGVIVLRYLLRNHPTHALVLRLGFLIAVTTISLRTGNAPYSLPPVDAQPLDRIFIGAVKLIWWMSAAWFAAACVRVFVRFEGQAREARVIQDLVVGMIYVGAVLSIIAYVFGAPVGTLLATSGVAAIILGLALQSTLSDLFSGIALNIARPYEIGDWIALPNGNQGRVIEMNWRATHLLNGNNDLVIMPNAELAKLTVINRSGPDRSHGETLTLRFVPSQRPSSIVETMRSALLSASGILQTPPPTVQVSALDADAATLELSFRVADFTHAGKAKSELLDLVYLHAKAADLSLASSHDASSSPSAEAMQPGLTAPRRLIEALSLFMSLSNDEKDLLAESLTRRTYRANELIAGAGSLSTSLRILRRGVITVEADSGELLRLSPGDYFGEAGVLTEVPESANFRALTPVVLYELGRETLAHLLEARPSLTEELAQHLAQRQAKFESAAMADNGPTRPSQSVVVKIMGQILAAVRR